MPDPYLVTWYSATEAIASSDGIDDAGLFQLDFRDERYLPFEFTGAISRWRIELPPENNQFDFDSISDLIIKMNYTAREGGEALRRDVREMVGCKLPDDGVRFIDVRHDLPDMWRAFQACERSRDDCDDDCHRRPEWSHPATFACHATCSRSSRAGARCRCIVCIFSSKRTT
jgi:Tc toxin complex TcA C-terminal TcB-binding domain